MNDQIGIYSSSVTQIQLRRSLSVSTALEIGKSFVVDVAPENVAVFAGQRDAEKVIASSETIFVIHRGGE